MEKIWCHFPKGQISDFVAVWERVITNCKLINDAYETLKNSLKHNLPLFINSSGFGSIWEAISSIYQGELEPQFASKDSYFGQNIKQVFRSNWRVINHPWTSYSSLNIIHTPYQKIWEHLGQFGDLDIKTSQRSKYEKKWKIGHFNKIKKMDITRGIIEWY